MLRPSEEAANLHVEDISVALVQLLHVLDAVLPYHQSMGSLKHLTPRCSHSDSLAFSLQTSSHRQGTGRRSSGPS